MLYDNLLLETEIKVLEVDMPPNIKGLYADNIAWINRGLPTRAEKACTLAEEIGHHYTTVGNILNQTDIRGRKLEILARRWAYSRLVPLATFVQAHQEGIRTRFEFAEMLGVTEEFLDFSIRYYQAKYGLYADYGGYTICFDPLGVLQFFE